MRLKCRQTSFRLIPAVFIVALTLGACANVKKQLGLGKSSPDEFSVLVNAPLSLPPDFNLRPPEAGAVRPGTISVQDQVKAVLFDSSPEGGKSKSETTIGERVLLARAESDAETSDIRAVINQDNAIYDEENSSFVDSLIFWRDSSPPGTVVVDAAKESQRIQEAEATGEILGAGETAVIIRRDRGILEGLF